MAETKSNVEFAHELSGHSQHHAPPTPLRVIGLIEAAVLAVVAVATAWSGYQASKWEGFSAKSYALYERYTVLSQEKINLAAQDRLYDSITFNGWVAAEVAGREKLAAFYERRFRPEYHVAFEAWMRLDPNHNLKAPPGPIFMPQYASANAQAAKQLSAESEKYFESGVDSRDRGDDYVRITVFLATILFLTALSQRFEFAGARVAITVVAAAFLIVSIFWLVTLPRI
ncbi:MAG TPA: hypothetical protein VEW74_05605, partial [Candidatus Nitrosotalea sp.]|nr:hypothetical protein [Candidatus Nitrosotalea sp.]